MLAAAGALCPGLTPSQPQRPLRGHLESLHSPSFQRTSSLRQKVDTREAFYSSLRAPTQLEESCFRRNVRLGRGSAGVVGSARKGCSRCAHHPAVPRAPGEGIPRAKPKAAARPSSHSRLITRAALARSQHRYRLRGAPATALPRALCRQRSRLRAEEVPRPRAPGAAPTPRQCRNADRLPTIQTGDSTSTAVFF